MKPKHYSEGQDVLEEDFLGKAGSTQPLSEIEGIEFEDLFDVDEIQELQDHFAKAVGVASLITRPDGSPITKPSNFSRLCDTIIRKTQIGEANCRRSDSMIGRYNPDGPIVQRCLSAGLANAGTSIVVAGRHIANWLIGQVRNELQEPEAILAYARQIGADEEAFMEAYEEIPYMSQEQFTSVALALNTLGKQLSTEAYQNAQRARFIEERKLAEQALRQSEERYRALYEDNPSMYFTIDPQGAVLSINRFGAEVLGYGADELLGKSGLTVFHPDDRGPVMEQFTKCLQNPMKVAHWEYRKIRKDGSLIWVREAARAVRTPEGDTVVLVVSEDITEVKKAQNELQRSNDMLRAIIEAAPTPIIDLDLEGNVRTIWNPAAEKMLGWTAKEVMGRPLPSVPPEKREEFRRFRELIHNGNTIDGVEVIRQRSDGTPIDYMFYASPLHDAEGRITGNISVLVDVTERNQAEKERERLQKQLLQAQKMEALGTLLGGIAHDFNNLLQIVVGYSDMLLIQKKHTEKEYAHLNAIRQAGITGGELANRILAFSRRLKPNARPVNLNDRIIRVKKMLERTLPRMIQIHLNLSHDLMTVSADPGQMEQVLLKFAVNAQHAMPDGGHLTFETANVFLDEEYSRAYLDTKPGQYALAKISDTGHGIEREVMEHIFEPFYTTKGPGDGTGLGLAIVFGIIKSHKGHITCRSKPGDGTTFYIYLPAIDSKTEDSPDSGEQTLAYGTETILLVDDEKSVLKVGEEMLRMAGYNVLTAVNGREALEVYRNNKETIGLVLLDLIMPEMGGKICLEELLKINPTIKVAVASGYSPNGPTEDALALGAKGFVAKPFQTGQLLQTVRKILDDVDLS